MHMHGRVARVALGLKSRKGENCAGVCVYCSIVNMLDDVKILIVCHLSALVLDIYASLSFIPIWNDDSICDCINLCTCMLVGRCFFLLN